MAESVFVRHAKPLRHRSPGLRAGPDGAEISTQYGIGWTPIVKLSPTKRRWPVAAGARRSTPSQTSDDLHRYPAPYPAISSARWQKSRDSRRTQILPAGGSSETWALIVRAFPARRGGPGRRAVDDELRGVWSPWRSGAHASRDGAPFALTADDASPPRAPPACIFLARPQHHEPHAGAGGRPAHRARRRPTPSSSSTSTTSRPPTTTGPHGSDRPRLHGQRHRDAHPAKMLRSGGLRVGTPRDRKRQSDTSELPLEVGASA